MSRSPNDREGGAGNGVPEPNGLDLAAARAARDAAIERVAKNADPEWWTIAINALFELAKVVYLFTTDQLIDVPEPREPRVWAAVLAAGRRAGWIEITNEVRVSANRRCHARRKAVWRSLLASEGS